MQNDMKTIYSLKVRLELRKRGFEPLMEFDNRYKVGLKCWVFEETPEFTMAFDEVMCRLGYEKGASRNGKE